MLTQMTQRLPRLLFFLLPALISSCGGRSSLLSQADSRNDVPLPLDRSRVDRLRVDQPRPDLFRPDHLAPDLPDLTATWAVSFGGKDPDQADAIAVDPWGNVLVTGYFGSTVAFGNTSFTSKGSADAFILKLSPTGKVLWARSIGGLGFDRGRAITTSAAGDVFVTIEFNEQISVGAKTLASHGGGDVLVARFTPNGDPVWATSGGGSGLDFSASIAATADAIYVAGTYFDGASFGDAYVSCPGRQALFVSKLNHAGDFSSTLTADATYWSHANAIALDGADVYVTGEYSGDFTFGGAKLPASGADIFVARLTSIGKVQWLARAGGPLDDAALSITISQGNPIITGYITNTATFGPITIGSSPLSMPFIQLFVAALSPQGAFLWATTAPGSQGAVGTAITTLSDSALVVGSLATTIGGIPIKGNAYVARVSQGKFPWADGFVGAPRATTTDKLGHVYVAGQFTFGTTLSGTKLTSGGGDDAFVWKFKIP